MGRHNTTKDEQVQVNSGLAMVAHELRAPLTSLRLLTEDLIESIQSSQTECSGMHWLEEVGQIHEIAMGMATTLDSLLDAARLEHSELRWETVNLDACCRDAIATIRPQIREEVEVMVRVDEGARSLRGDADALRRLLTNLLANACTHTERGRIEVQARSADPDGISLSVSDTGCGIDEGVLSRLGEPFIRGAGKRGGSGLGLWICRAIASAHGGELRVSTVPGAGTTVDVLLRRDLAEPASPIAAAPIRPTPMLTSGEAA